MEKIPGLKNLSSVDKVSTMYREFYENKKRGFTEDEFNTVCEQTAGVSLKDFFEYISTTKEIDYPKYFSYAGLVIDTTSKELPGGWLGINTRQRNDSCIVSAVDWNSPAWQSGIRQRDVILELDDITIVSQKLNGFLQSKMPGDKIKISYMHRNEKIEKEIILGKKTEKQFQITRMANPDALQKEIFVSWLKE